MKGDFTRSTHDPRKHYSSVRMQQGRVQLDADWNEQIEIENRLRETALQDLIGRTGAPRVGGGFRIDTLPDNRSELYISPGRYYVDGILCELDAVEIPIDSPISSTVVRVSSWALEGIVFQPNERVTIVDDTTAGSGALLTIASVNNTQITFTESIPAAVDFGRNPRVRRLIPLANQHSTLTPPLAVPQPLQLNGAGVYVAYLDVWQRHVTAVEDPSIRETALGGADTATRTQTFWQVRLLRAGNRGQSFGCTSEVSISAIAPSTGRLRARTAPTSSTQDPCIIPGGAGYTRPENQLYRVEVHQPGSLGSATFKWSRDNGSVVTGWLGQDAQDPNRITVGSAGPDSIIGFAPGQWIELMDDSHEINGAPGTFAQIARVEGNVLILAQSATQVQRPASALNPRIRRWDTAPGTTSTTPAIQIRNSGDGTNNGWLPLEGGIEVYFEAGNYRTGDYWLIPARSFGGVAGTIEWSSSGGRQLPQLPHGGTHRYSRLAVIDYDGSGFTVQTDCRPVFSAITDQVIAASQVTYTPPQGSDLPAITNTVQLAIDEAFRRTGGVRDAAIRIQRVYPLADVPLATVSFENDSLVSASRLSFGLRVACDQTVSNLSFQSQLTGLSGPEEAKPSCQLILDLPYPLPGDSQWSPNYLPSSGLPIGFQSVVLSGTASASGQDIFWRPTLATQVWLSRFLMDRMLGLNPSTEQSGFASSVTNRVLARFLLKGNFIFGGAQNALYLDGDSFGVPVGTAGQIGLSSTAGDGRRGGDFEMWVWLTQLFRMGTFTVASLPPPVGRALVYPEYSGPSQVSGQAFQLPANTTITAIELMTPQGSVISGTGSISSNGSFSINLPRTPTNQPAWSPGVHFIRVTLSNGGYEIRDINLPAGQAGPPPPGSAATDPEPVATETAQAALSPAAESTERTSPRKSRKPGTSRGRKGKS